MVQYCYGIDDIRKLMDGGLPKSVMAQMIENSKGKDRFDKRAALPRELRY